MRVTELLATPLTGAQAASDIKALYHAAHTLKSSSNLVGAGALFSLAKEMEALARAGQTQALDGYLAGLRVEFERYRDEPAIREILSASTAVAS